MAKENFVVCLNYKNPKDKKHRWLWRTEGQDADAALPASSICTTRGLFRKSARGEVGFGGNIVAYCDDAKLNADTPTGVELQAIDFDGLNFIKRFKKETILSFKGLVLEPNGDMFVILDETPVTSEILPGTFEVPFSDQL